MPVAPSLQPGNDDLLDRFQRLLVNVKPDQPRQVTSVSHFKEPIPGDAEPHGNSRIWGDVPHRIAVQVISRMLAAVPCDRDEQAFLLALVRTESGFNPDAASATSSASGLGQFTDRTRGTLAARLKIFDIDPFRLEPQLKLLGAQLRECLRFADKNATRPTDRWTYAYAYHHDGPDLAYGGRQLAVELVLPWMDIAMECLMDTKEVITMSKKDTKKGGKGGKGC